MDPFLDCDTTTAHSVKPYPLDFVAFRVFCAVDITGQVLAFLITKTVDQIFKYGMITQRLLNLQCQVCQVATVATPQPDPQRIGCGANGNPSIGVDRCILHLDASRPQQVNKRFAEAQHHSFTIDDRLQRRH